MFYEAYEGCDTRLAICEHSKTNFCMEDFSKAIWALSRLRLMTPSTCGSGWPATLHGYAERLSFPAQIVMYFLSSLLIDVRQIECQELCIHGYECASQEV